MNVQPFWEGFPEIDLDDVVLREIREEDAKEYYEYMSNDQMEGFLTRENRPENLDRALEELRYWRSLFHSKRSIYWCIALKKNDKMIGTAGFNNILFAHDRGEISYDLDPNYWGNGYMLKSIKAILKYADLVLQLKRVQATVIIDNQRSLNVLERTGFEREGFLKKFEIVEGEHKDYYMYGRVVE